MFEKLRELPESEITEMKARLLEQIAENDAKLAEQDACRAEQKAEIARLKKLLAERGIDACYRRVKRTNFAIGFGKSWSLRTKLLKSGILFSPCVA